jgi:transposase
LPPGFPAVHSCYERRLADTGVAGREVLIQLRVRRFFCAGGACGKKAFAEQVPGLAIRYGRVSTGLREALRAIALALGGRAGARLACRLAAGVNRMTLIRLLRGLPSPGPVTAPQVLGVDEFALRRGHSYGTLLVDVQARRPVDILAERSADSSAAWLAARPGAEVICRDRAGCYAGGAARGAPEAIQVAGRWHLWHNLGEAAGRAVARRSRCLRTAAAAEPAAAAGDALAVMPAVTPAGPVRSDRTAIRTRQRHAAIHHLLAGGRSVRAISGELGLARNTVRRFARASDPGELLVNDGTGRRPSMIGDYEPYLLQRWNAGCTDAAQLWREIRARGYPGGYPLVRDHLAPLRGTTTAPARPPAPPKPRKVTAWVMTRPAVLPAGDRDRLDAILAGCPELATLQAHVQAFARMMTERRGRDLETSMDGAAATGLPELRSFVTGLRRDQDAVTAGLTPSAGTPAQPKATSTPSRCSNGRCTDARTPACSASASSSLTSLTQPLSRKQCQSPHWAAVDIFGSKIKVSGRLSGKWRSRGPVWSL